jgi:hypothetical protein
MKPRRLILLKTARKDCMLARKTTSPADVKIHSPTLFAAPPDPRAATRKLSPKITEGNMSDP